MEQLKLTIAIIIAVLLQWTLRNVAEPFAYIDFPLIIVVYAALQHNSIRAILFGTFSGLAVDALSGGLLGSNAFTKTLIAYIVSEIARRVYMDNLLLRIPVVAGACLLNGLIYYGMHRLVRPGAFGRRGCNDLIYADRNDDRRNHHLPYFRQVFSERRSCRANAEMFKARRQTRRRNPIRLGK